MSAKAFRFRVCFIAFDLKMKFLSSKFFTAAALIFVVVILFIVFLYLKPADLPAVGEPQPSETPKVEEPKKDYERNFRLQGQTDRLVKLFGEMPLVPVYLTDEIINKKGTNTERGVAYTTCSEKGKPEIFLKKVFYQKANQKQLVNILKHELTHAWQCHQDLTWGHDEKFYKKFRSVGGIGN